MSERRDEASRYVNRLKAINREARAMLARHDQHARRMNFARCGCDDCKPFRAVYEQWQESQQSDDAVGLSADKLLGSTRA